VFRFFKYKYVMLLCSVGENACMRYADKIVLKIGRLPSAPSCYQWLRHYNSPTLK